MLEGAAEKIIEKQLDLVVGDITEVSGDTQHIFILILILISILAINFGFNLWREKKQRERDENNNFHIVAEKERKHEREERMAADKNLHDLTEKNTQAIGELAGLVRELAAVSKLHQKDLDIVKNHILKKNRR